MLGDGNWTPLDAGSDFRGMLDADGITQEAKDAAEVLIAEYDRHVEHNRILKDYYDCKVTVSDYGVAADGIANDQTCGWPAKAVTAWAERISLERISANPYADAELLDGLVERNGLINSYNQHVPVKGLYGCMAATVNRGMNGHARIRFHGADTFTAIPSPDFTDSVVAMGLAIARREYTQWSMREMVPTVVHLYMPHNVGEFRQYDSGQWVYEDGPSAEELPTMYVFAHKRVGTVAPFGQTRITRHARTLTQDAIRCLWHMQVSGAFYSMAKLYAIGLTDEQFDAIIEDKSRYQLSRLLALTANEMTGRDPQVGQLSGNSPQPFIDELRALAQEFCNETDLPLDALGIIHDNPSSAEAIQMSRESIGLVAERDITADTETLKYVVRAALAIEGNTTTDELDENTRNVKIQFADAIRHSPASKADWALKVASMREGFGQTDVAARAVGITDDELDELKSEEATIIAQQAMRDLFTKPMQQTETEPTEDNGDDTAMDGR